jgi:hypothetical protein
MVIAFVSGICGGLVPRAFRVEVVSAAPIQPLKCSRFELVDTYGRTKAIFESGAGGGAKLTFFDTTMKTPLELGLGSTGRPFVQLNGPDGRMRATLRLIEGAKPTLLMGDGTWEQRLQLGATQPDVTGSGSDVWALLLGNPFDRDLLVGLAMNTTGGRAAGFGSLSIRSSDGKRWDAPLGK